MTGRQSSGWVAARFPRRGRALHPGLPPVGGGGRMPGLMIGMGPNWTALSHEHARQPGQPMHVC